MSKADDRRRAREARALEMQRQQQRRRRLVVGGVVAVVLALVLGIGIAVQALRDTTGDTPQAVPQAATEDYGIVVGDADAPRTITIYEDLQCPICAEFEAAVGEQLAAAVAAGEVNVEYRLVSFLDGQSENEYSSRALNALLATLDAAGVDAFKSMHDQLYADQPAEGTAGPEDDELIADAVAAGASEDDVRGAVEDKAYEQWITNATDAMSQNGVNGTPTVHVDGEPAGSDPVAAVLDAIGG